MSGREWEYDGFDGRRFARTWDDPNPRYVALLCHGYGEHIGRYEYVADTLVRHGAAVYGADHVGHGRSEGERVLIEDYERVVDDFHLLDRTARTEHPDVPVVLIGHSMGGLIATRYAQRYGDTLAALVLSGPVLGRWDVVQELLAQDPIPYTPIDPGTLSRDPAVGEVYAADPLVWHGPFKRPTLEALQACIDTINRSGTLGSLPTLWLHGMDDRLVPLEQSREGIERIRGPRLESIGYPDSRHEIFNEIDKDRVLGDVTAFIDRVLKEREAGR